MINKKKQYLTQSGIKALYKSLTKVIMQGKLIVLVILCVHIETGSLWAEFVNKNRCISDCLVSVEDKSI